MLKLPKLRSPIFIKLTSLKPLRPQAKTKMEMKEERELAPDLELNSIKPSLPFPPEDSTKFPILKIKLNKLPV